MAYNLTFMENATNLADITTGINVTSGHVFGILFLFALFLSLIAMMKSRGYDTIVTLSASGFVASIFGALLMFGGWITWIYAVIPFIIFMIATVVYYFQD